MKRLFLLISCMSVLLTGCSKSVSSSSEDTETSEDSIVAAATERLFPTRVCDIPLPDGFARVKIEDSTSFGAFLRSLPIAPEGTEVLTYKGERAWTTDVCYGVIAAYGPSNEDLQQCADAIIRLRAEWLYQNKRYDEIAFHFTNGWLCEYKRWADGERVRVEGNKASWYKAYDKADYSYGTFEQYLREVFRYAGTLSLEKELERIHMTEIQAGDVFIKGGSPGHAIIVVDVAEDVEAHDGDKCFIVAESYMPAQDIHILKNVHDRAGVMGPWYRMYDVIRTGYDYDFGSYSFSFKDMKRFK